MIHLCECIYFAAKSKWQDNFKRSIMCTSCLTVMTLNCSPLHFEIKDKSKRKYSKQLLPFHMHEYVYVRVCSIVALQGFSLDASLFWCTHCLLAASNSCTLPSLSSSYGSVLTQMAFKAPVLLVLKKFALSGSLSLAQTLG